MVYVQLILTPTVLVCETVVVGIVVVLDEIVEDPATVVKDPAAPVVEDPAAPVVEDPAAPVGATAIVC